MAATTAASPPPTTNRRRRVRHKVQTPAYASFTAESKGAMLDLNEILNISEDGVAVQCASPLEKDRRLDLCLDLAESSGQIYTTGQVIWSDASGRSGLRFSDLPPASLLRLREWLFFNAMSGVANAQAESGTVPLPSLEHASVRPNYTDTLAAVTAVQREVESLGSDLSQALALIATRAQVLVRASSAAVALAATDPDFMVCRASAGSDAPPVGARLQVGAGFSGECVRSGKLLRCDDTETDTRVDRESCRALGLRAMLAAPVRDSAKVIGLLEVFSAKPNSFTEGDTVVLQRLADTILAAVNRDARPQDVAVPASTVPSPASSAGSVPFASEAGEKTEKAKNDSESEGQSSGIHLPRSHLVVLFCAAATIFLALGFLLAPSIQALFQSSRSPQQTVLASSHPPVASISPSVSPGVDTATLPQLQQLAARGDARAQNALGLRYATGDGVNLDEREAARWFIRAAEQGNVNAQSKLGSLYWVGRGVPPSLNQAYFWTVLARAGGDEGSKTLAIVLYSHLTRSQSLAIEQQAEAWLEQHRAGGKPRPGR
jgi:putative methionine-R-sulfoxide reductase with GAF domain